MPSNRAHTATIVSPVRAWTVWAIAATSFAFAFFQRVAPSVMVEELMREFNVGAAVLGNLAAVYFYAYAGLQLPIGLMLDRFGARRLLSSAAAVAALGSLLFALATGLQQAYLGRLLIGIGCAVGFVATLTLAGHWFPPRRFAYVSGLTMLVGMLGGIAGQAPLALLVDAVGWRPALLGATLFAAALGAATWLVVRDDPPGRSAASTRHDATSFARNVRRVIGSGHIWLVAAYGGLMTGPMLSYAGLWGVPHLVQVHGLPRPLAAFSASLVMIGWALGAPLGGWLSDHIGRRKLPMASAAALALGGWCILLYGPVLPLPLMWTLLVLIGVASGAMVVCLALARELVAPDMAGAATGFVNMANVGSGALLQPLLGLVLDLNWTGVAVDGVRSYAPHAFDMAFVILPCCAAGALLMALLVPESRCRPLSAGGH